MLTPVDIQQRKFHVGLGYDKKDVNTFFEEVSASYEQLYRSNAELKEKVVTLTDALQHYRSKESELEKSIKIAEKDSEDTKSKAYKEAKNIELDAKNKAKVIIGDAEERLEQIKTEMAMLETQYAAYKSNFASLMKQQFQQLKDIDFDVDSYIDERALTLLGGNVAPRQNSSSSDSFGSYDGDPQMRDESTLGGMSGGGTFGSGGDINSTSAVYTSSLGANEDFVDPFNPASNNRYNPFEDTSVDNRNTKAVTGQSSFKVSAGDDKKKFKRTPPSGANAAKSAAKASSPSVKQESKSAAEKMDANTTQTTTKPEAKSEPEKNLNSEMKSESIKDIKPEVKPEVAKEAESGVKTPRSNTVDNSDPIPVVHLYPESSLDEDDELVGDVEDKPNSAALLGDGTESEETDEFGFEFI